MRFAINHIRTSHLVCDFLIWFAVSLLPRRNLPLNRVYVRPNLHKFVFSNLSFLVALNLKQTFVILCFSFFTQESSLRLSQLVYCSF